MLQKYEKTSKEQKKSLFLLTLSVIFCRHHNYCLALTSPGFHRLEEYAEKDEGDAEVEGEIDFAALAEDEEGEDDGIAGFQVVCQVNGEGGETF